VAGAEGGARTARWFDSHCHLQDRYLPGGVAVAEAVAEAEAAGVGALVCIGTDADTSLQALAVAADIRSTAALCEQGSSAFKAWATVGLHPHDASRGMDDVARLLAESLRMAGDVVVAVGECGLDYHYDHSPRSVQREVFRAQVALAKQYGLSLVVHCREAWDDTLALLRHEGPPERTILHCFTGGPDEARQCLDFGAFLSFSGIVTFKNADDVRAAVRVCPMDRLLVETDAPFLAPVPHRGAENRPAWVAVVGEAVAAIKGVAPEALAVTSTATAATAFALDDVAIEGGRSS
jgi:TatD DNase family protein